MEIDKFTHITNSYSAPFLCFKKYPARTNSSNDLSKSHRSRFVNLITNSHLSFKLKLKENEDENVVNQSKIKKEGG